MKFQSANCANDREFNAETQRTQRGAEIRQKDGGKNIVLYYLPDVAGSAPSRMSELLAVFL
jgi:hypothetical protein